MYTGVELRQVRCAIAVADELHFTRAAEKLHITQSALTRQIRQLELELGVDLFLRDTRRVELTDAGRALIDDGRKALEFLEHGIRRAMGVGKGEVEQLRIAYSPFVDIHFFSQLRNCLAQAHPELEIEYVSEGDPGQIQDLVEGRYHAGIGTLPVDDVALSAARLYEEPMLVVLRKDHRLARKRRVHVSELGDDPVIWVPPKVLPSFYSHFLEWCRKQGYAPNVKQYVTSISEILDFVAEGVGVGFVKASASKLRPDILAFCLVGNPTYLVRTGIIYRTDCRSQILRGLVVGLTNRFPCTQNETSGRTPRASGAPRARSK